MDKIYDAGISRKMLTEEEIKERVAQLGAQITEDYSKLDGELIVVCLLKGSVIFTADLCRELKLPLKLDFMAVSSYGDATESSREVKINKELDENIMGKHVLIVEDIIDTGRTLSKIKDILGTRDPKSLKIVTLLDKPSRREIKVDVDYVGFQIEDEFVIGYGLDFAREYRNIPYVGIMGPQK